MMSVGQSWKGRGVFFLFSLVLLFASSPLRAQVKVLATAVPSGTVPDEISYQGRLMQNGYPVTGTEILTFYLYDAPTGGNVLWQSGPVQVQVSQGVFGTSLNISTTALAGPAQKYIETDIETTPLLPRQALLSVPYALMARNIEGDLTISTVSVTGTLTSTGTIAVSTLTAASGFSGINVTTSVYVMSGVLSVGTSASSNTLTVNGGIFATSSVTAEDGFYGTGLSATGNISANSAILSGSLTTSSATVEGNSFSVGNSTLVVTNGNVGIGTSSPAQSLDILGTPNGTAGIHLNSAVPGNTSLTLYNSNGTLMWNNTILNAGGGSVSGTSGQISEFVSANSLGNSIMNATGSSVTVAGALTSSSATVSGYVSAESSVTAGTGFYGSGVGLSSVPASSLTGQVNPANLVPTVAYTTASNNFTVGQSVTGNVSVTGNISATGNMSASSAAITNSLTAGSVGISSVPASGNLFAVGASTLVVAQNGNVGIGTASPQYQLDVSSYARVGGVLSIGLTYGYTYCTGVSCGALAATCPTGTIVLSGGCTSSSSSYPIFQSYPTTSGSSPSNAWNCAFTGANSSSSNSAFAICARLGP